MKFCDDFLCSYAVFNRHGCRFCLKDDKVKATAQCVTCVYMHNQDIVCNDMCNNRLNCPNNINN